MSVCAHVNVCILWSVGVCSAACNLTVTRCDKKSRDSYLFASMTVCACGPVTSGLECVSGCNLLSAESIPVFKPMQCESGWKKGGGERESRTRVTLAWRHWSARTNGGDSLHHWTVTCTERQAHVLSRTFFCNSRAQEVRSHDIQINLRINGQWNFKFGASVSVDLIGFFSLKILFLSERVRNLCHPAAFY